MSEAGLFAVDVEARTVRGYLLPWGVKSKPNKSGNAPITFERGSITVPRDVSVVSLNSEHDRHMPLGRAQIVRDDEQGLFTEYLIADTDEGDQWLADHDGQVGLSAELRDIVRTAGDYGRAILTGAAVTRAPAFEGAGLFSTLDPETVEQDEPADDDDADSVDDETADDETADDEKDETMGDAVVPEAMLAGRRQAPEQGTLAHLARAIVEARSTGRSSLLAAMGRAEQANGLFALADITYDKIGGTGENVVQPAWLGQLWAGRGTTRRVIELLSSAPLTSLTRNGWRWLVAPEVDSWQGNKAPIPSNAPTTEPATFATLRLAGGHDIAREWVDFNDTEMIQAYLLAMTTSYAKKSDAYVLTQLQSQSTPFLPGTVPGDVDPGLAAIVDGALEVVANDGLPTFAVVAPDVYRPFLFTPHTDALEYLSMSVSLTEGEIDNFRIVPDARLASGTVIVGDSLAAKVRELPGSPIRVSAENLAQGGLDEALFGYVGLDVEHPATVVSTTLTATP